MRTNLVVAALLSAVAYAGAPTAAAVPTPLPTICVEAQAPSTCQMPAAGRNNGRTVLDIQPFDSVSPSATASDSGK
jgi:hypothetical protein